jgi:hypothetical protein
MKDGQRSESLPDLQRSKNSEVRHAPPRRWLDEWRSALPRLTNESWGAKTKERAETPRGGDFLLRGGSICGDEIF